MRIIDINVSLKKSNFIAFSLNIKETTHDSKPFYLKKMIVLKVGIVT